MEALKPKTNETKWDPSLELKIIEEWEKEKEEEEKEKEEENLDNKLLVIDTPPPYASGKWHVGGAAHYSQIDMISRYYKLKGFKVITPFYADRNGLPVEVQVEKAYNIKANEFASTPEGREKFLNLCKNFLDNAEKEIVNVWKRLGCSFDYWKEGTDSEKYRKMTQKTFTELYKKGLIYEDERPVRWCPRCGTTLAEAEIEYDEEEGYLYYINFKIKGEERYVTVATTRPELLASCAALIYNPKDERYKDLKGKKAISPLYENELEIFEHPSVDMSFGTGLMMVCSYGDENDVRLFKELNLKPKVLIGPIGTMLPNSGILSGLTVNKAREKIAEELDKKKLLVKKEKIRHSIPVCWRCKTPLQIINRREFFLKQLSFKDELKEIINKIDIRPEMHKKKLLDWIDSISMDWPISRDRFYGTEIPVWRCTNCNSILIPPEENKYYRPWKDEIPFDKCPVCNAPKEKIVGEKRVFDTWFDSSISVLYVTKWNENKEFFEKAIQNTLRPQGEDIIRSWLYYSLLRVYQLTKRPAFKYIRITGMGLDPKGRPMHKSLGNVIDPDPIISKYGADSFRFWAAISAKLGYDYRFDENKIITGRNFATKIWNLTRFISSFPYLEGEYRDTEKAFLALTQDYIEKIDKGYQTLDMFEPISLLYELIWDIFASNYVELVKNRAYNKENEFSKEEQISSWRGLHEMFKSSLIMLSPIMPFITYYSYKILYNKNINEENIPKPWFNEEEKQKLMKDALEIIEINKEIWAYKKSHNISLNKPIEGKIIIDESLSKYVKDLRSLHKTEFITSKEAKGEKIGKIYLVK
ncbi:valyl-tRNA synthetase [Caldisphaera lagunensis DSM 15908]|uniref:Valine--tRNA ligase n=1 Tax=Caldisphaera lagunensis (strain DSM 15908 / JCM 11604 / ANMR 0165 / IC-154) TaxID=1056495 RepID=L0AC00_CALLD|nr:valine--tRNA ligase [Caldisphaera lagunensis]AFZ70959.1 valyl-tRNA synthetase [Caldisphaera lagunensis DSM 15908]